MKLSNIIYTLLIGLSAVYFSSCGSETITQDTSILLDQTEDYFIHISFDEFMAISVTAENINNGERARIQPITESGFHAVEEFEIEKVENTLLGNDYRRKKEIESYFEKIKKSLAQLDSGKSNKDGSVIFKSMVEELNRLSLSKAEIKQLIVCTDGIENSSLANFYDPATFRLLENNPEILQKQFIEKYPLQDLSGIHIYIIYKPLNRTDSERFEIVSNFYKSLFESYGANVTISGSL